jgi:hypothetical protein
MGAEVPPKPIREKQLARTVAIGVDRDAGLARCDVFFRHEADRASPQHRRRQCHVIEPIAVEVADGTTKQTNMRSDRREPGG